MMQSSKNNHFTAIDIERYHAGKMSMAEMHALEKAALDDPFLADALEGYAFTSTPSADIQKIKKRLEEKSENKKAVPLFPNYTWLKVAAVILVIAGSGWFALKIFTPLNETIAFETPKEQKKNSNDITSTKPVTTDTITEKVNNDIVSADVPSQQISNQKTSNPSSPNRDLAIKDEKKIIDLPAEKDIAENKWTRNTTPQNATASSPVNINTEEAVRRAKEEVTYRSRNTDFQNRAYSEPTLTNNVRNQQSNNYNYKIITDSANYVAIDKVNNNATRDTITNFNIILKPIEGQLSEVVVLGKGKKTDPNARMPKVTIDTLEPAEGFTRFDDYIAANIKSPDELKLKSIRGGEVELSFEVNRKGEPVNITVIKSLCNKCDEEAIRLLKEGPKWKKKKNKKGKITIKFDAED